MSEYAKLGGYNLKKSGTNTNRLNLTQVAGKPAASIPGQCPASGRLGSAEACWPDGTWTAPLCIGNNCCTSCFPVSLLGPGVCAHFK